MQASINLYSLEQKVLPVGKRSQQGQAHDTTGPSHTGPTHDFCTGFVSLKL